jgi:hypothetical protein
MARLHIHLFILSFIAFSCNEEKLDIPSREYEIITGKNKIFTDYLKQCERNKLFYLPKLFSTNLKSPNLVDSLKKYNNAIGYSFAYLEYRYSHFDSLSKKYTLYFNNFDNDLIELSVYKNDYANFKEKTNIFNKFSYSPILILSVNSISKLNTDSTMINWIKGDYKYLIYSKKK